MRSRRAACSSRNLGSLAYGPTVAAFFGAGAVVVEFDLGVAFTVAAFFAGATFFVDGACGLVCSTALAGPPFLVALTTFLAGTPADLAEEDFAALGVGWVALALMGREPAWAVPVALAVLAALAELLAGAAFFTAVTSTSSQGVVDLAL